MSSDGSSLEMSKLSFRLCSSLVFALGFFGGCVHGKIYAELQALHIDSLVVFQRLQHPSVIRAYRDDPQQDALFVEDTSQEGVYIPLDQYLDTFGNAYDQTIEQAHLEKLVDW